MFIAMFWKIMRTSILKIFELRDGLDYSLGKRACSLLLTRLVVTNKAETNRSVARISNSAFKMQDLLYTLFSPQLYITLKVLI